MKLYRLLFFTSCILLNVVVGANAATYYVDYSAGLDTNNGTSTDNAFKHCPGDTNATNIAASTTISAGDTVYFKGGVSYIGLIHLNRSGSSGIPITYDGNSSGSWGTGKAIINGNNVYYQGFLGNTGTPQYITINNFEIKNIKYYVGSTNESRGIRIDSSSNNITISNCYIHDVGYWNNDGSVNTGDGGSSAILGIFATSWTISNNEITKTGGRGIDLDGPVNCIISGNNIHHYVNWGIDIHGDARQPNNNLITGNTIHDLYQYDTGFWGGASGTEPHQDFIFIRQGSGSKPINTTIEKNLFYNNYTFNDFGGTAMIFPSYADTTTIRNNVFINPHSYNTVWLSWPGYGTKIYNNTIYSPRSGVTAIALTTDISGPENTQIYNNIIIGGIWALDFSGTTYQTYLSSNNNIFVGGIGGYSPSQNYSLAQWKALGFDSASQSFSSSSSIGFVDTSGYPTSCNTMNLGLKSGSLAIDKGTTITGFTTDILGTSRPQGAAWDIGAYEFDGVRVPYAPNSLNIE